MNKPVRLVIWKSISVLLAICFFTAEAGAFWNSPSCNSYVATVGTLLLKPRVDQDSGVPIVPIETIKVSFYPERSKLLGSHKKAETAVMLSVGQPNAPVLYLLNGLGSSANASYAVYLMDQLHDMGFTVVSLPSTFNETATLGFSTHVRPGLSSQDLPDLMRLIDAIGEKIKSEYGIISSSKALMGVSMGAFHAAAVLSRPEFESRFKKFVLINPPLDLRYGISILDKMVDGGNKLASKRKDEVNEVRTAYVENNETRDAEGLGEEIHYRSFGDRELSYLIGSSMRSSVHGTVVSSQKVKDDGFLKKKTDLGRKLEIKNWPIKKYFDLVAVPFYQDLFAKNGKVLDLDYELSIWPHLTQAPHPSQVLMLHSQDDFISSPNELKKLPLLANPTVLSKCGGHVGALGYSVYMDALKNFLRDLE